MKTKTILTGIVALATIALLVACSNNKTAPTTNPSKTEQSSNKTNDLQTFIKENKELIKTYRASFYLSGISQDFRKVENDADKKGEQVFLNPIDVDKRLRKLKVDIGNYNSDTKRLSVTVTNNYSEDILGYNDNKDSDIEHQTSIRIKGYFKEQIGIKPSELLIGFRPKVSIKSGESVTFQILMPYYDATDTKDADASLKNDKYDSMYILSDYLEGTFVYPNNDQNKQGRSAMSNFGNYFADISMYFKNYPREASISDKEIVERYNLMKK